MNRFKIWVRVTGNSLALLALIAVGSMTPATALGTDQELQKAERFCSNISGVRDDVSKKMTASQSDQQSLWQTQNERMNLIKRQFAADTASYQNEIDSAHQKNLAAMRVAYANPGNEKVIDEYAASSKQVTVDRRAIIADTQDRFAAAASDLLESRQAVLAGQTEAFRLTVDDALSAASASCQDNPEDTTVQSALNDQLIRARKVFTSSNQTDESVKGKLVALETTRNVVISKANLSAAQQLIVLSGNVASLRR